MLTRLLIVVALVGSLFGAMPAVVSATPDGPTCGPYLTLTPAWGPAGTQVSANVFHFPANVTVEIVVKVAGEPVVGSATTNADGHANVVFTMPSYTGDYVNVLAKAPPCNVAGAHFWNRPLSTPPPRTSTPPPPPTVTPPPPTTVVPPPTITVIPQPPAAGSGIFGGPGINIALLAIVMVVFTSGFALWGSARRNARATVARNITIDPHDRD